nr:TIM barrel protein [Paenibacillus polymyxa]
MKIAGMNITYRHFPFEHFLDHVTELGIEHIELWAGEPHLYVYRNVLGNLRHIRQQLKSRDMKVVCYTPEQCVYPFNIAASDSQLRQKSIVYFIDNLYAALELETNMMLVTSGIGDFAVSQLESWKYASDSIYQISRVAEKEGVTFSVGTSDPIRIESNYRC